MEKLTEQFIHAYDAHMDAVFRYCFYKTNDRELAKDLMQQTGIHNIHIGNLSANTQYFYSVSSTGKSGNVSAVVNGSSLTPSM